MTRFFGPVGLAAAGLMCLAMADASLADSGGGDRTYQPRNWQSLSIQRYPGDQAFAGGTVRMQGPDKGPYVERCRWTAKPGAFGLLPFGLTQNCHRYTLENTPE